MNIVGVGFQENNLSCYKLEFLKQLQMNISGMEIQNEIPTEADILLVNLDRFGAYKLFGSGIMPPQNAYTIFIVHELHRAVLPYLKLADLVIFTHPDQQEVCEKLLGLHYNCCFMTLPALAPVQELTHVLNKKFIFIKAYDLTSLKAIMSRYELLNELMNDAHLFNVDLMFGGQVTATAAGKLFCRSFQENFSSVNCLLQSSYSREKFFALSTAASRVIYVSDQVSEAQYSEFLEARSPQMTIQTISDEPLLREWKSLGIHAECSDILENKMIEFDASIEQWVNFIKDLSRGSWKEQVQARRSQFKNLEIDTLADLNIVYGKPLNNKYIFSVCFRNQEKQIVRCLESLVSQNQELDFGVVLVDDQSSDQSTEVIVNFLKQFPEVNACVVYNPVNRRAARNFYNVIHLLTTRIDAVIMEVDGDDFLAHTGVLDVLHRVYERGALKTNGSYKGYPEDQGFLQAGDIKRHHELLDYNEPWNIDKCNSWLHLRTTRRDILTQIKIEYFLDRHTKTWITDRHDAAIQPRAIELAKGHCVFIPEVIYTYDLGGNNHDHDSNQNEEMLKFFFHLDKIWHPLILDPKY
jgi:hypothetical protein